MINSPRPKSFYDVQFSEVKKHLNQSEQADCEPLLNRNQLTWAQWGVLDHYRDLARERSSENR